MENRKYCAGYVDVRDWPWQKRENADTVHFFKKLFLKILSVLIVLALAIVFFLALSAIIPERESEAQEYGGGRSFFRVKEGSRSVDLQIAQNQSLPIYTEAPVVEWTPTAWLESSRFYKVEAEYRVEDGETGIIEYGTLSVPASAGEIKIDTGEGLLIAKLRIVFEIPNVWRSVKFESPEHRGIRHDDQEPITGPFFVWPDSTVLSS